MIGRTNAVSKPGVELSLVVSVTSGAAVTATKGSKTVNGTAAGGSCVLSLPEAGTWSVKATLNGQTSDTKSVSVVDSYAVALTFFSATITVNVDSGASVTLKKGGTTIATKTSNGTAVFTVTETGAYTVTATKNGQTTSGSVNVVSGTTSYSLTLSFVSSTLNNNEWSVIKSVSDAGQGANYWSIGDRKAVTLNGTVGKLSLSNVTTYAFIIGFNHNASVEGTNRIHFQLAKTALSGGTDVCLCDSSYNSNVSTTGYFSMNSSRTNSGGWASSQMRTNICGTSLSSYSGTIIAVIPAALRAVLKSVTKYTDNTANGGGSTASYVTATTDYFFLLYFLIFFEAINPFGMSVLFQKFRHRSQCFLAISQYSYIYLYILINFRRIDIKMNHFCLFGISSQITGHTVVKTHPDSNQDITFISVHIRSEITVHSQHTFVQRMLGRQSRQSQQRTSGGHICLFDESTQFLLCVAQFHTLPHQYQRALCTVN